MLLRKFVRLSVVCLETTQKLLQSFQFLAAGAINCFL